MTTPGQTPKKYTARLLTWDITPLPIELTSWHFVLLNDGTISATLPSPPAGSPGHAPLSGPNPTKACALGANKVWPTPTNAYIGAPKVEKASFPQPTTFSPTTSQNPPSANTPPPSPWTSMPASSSLRAFQATGCLIPASVPAPPLKPAFSVRSAS